MATAQLTLQTLNGRGFAVPSGYRKKTLVSGSESLPNETMLSKGFAVVLQTLHGGGS